MSKHKVSHATAMLAAMVAGSPVQFAPKPKRVGPALPPEPKEAKPKMRVKVVRHIVELWEVKADSPKAAKSRALRGVGKRVTSSTTATYASVVAS